MIEALLNGTLEWQNSLWLWGLLVPFIFSAVKLMRKKQQKQGYADAHLWPWIVADQSNVMESIHVGRLVNSVKKLGRLFSAGKLVAIAWIALMVAMAGPRSLDQSFTMETRSGVDLLVDIDISASMKAEDIQPSRFIFARNLAETIAGQLKPQDRIGLGVFAGQAHSVIPLTHDKAVFNQALANIYPGLLPTKGSWLELALVHDLNLLEQTAKAAKVLVVLTDGTPPFWKAMDLPEVTQGLPAARSQAFKDTGVKVIYVGVGLNRSSPIPDANDKTGKLHVNGLVVQSRLEESQLQRLAQQTDGVYMKADASPGFMQKLMTEIDSAAIQQQNRTELLLWHDYSMPFIWLAFIALILAFYGRSLIYASLQKQQQWSGMGMSGKNIWFAILFSQLALFGAGSIWPEPVSAAMTHSEQLQQAHDAFAAKDYERAQALYDAVSNYDGYFGAGASAYRLGELESAVLYFREAAWQAKTPQQRAKALLNLGNSFYQSNLLPQAIEAFGQALLYQSPYAKAEHNLTLAKERLELEIKGKLKQNQADEDGKGGKGKDAEGAFYGGQKPNSDPSDDGSGAEGEGQQSEKSRVELPQADKLTDYSLNPSIAQLRMNSSEKDSEVNSVLQVQRQRQRAERFEHQLQQLEDDQSLLLKRVFEREEGFEAAQEEAHAIPGVQPW